MGVGDQAIYLASFHDIGDMHNTSSALQQLRSILIKLRWCVANDNSCSKLLLTWFDEIDNEL